MSQNPGQWGQQGGYGQQGPPPNPPQGGPQQGGPQQGYPQQGYPQQGGYIPQGGYGPQPPAGGGQNFGTPPGSPKKSNAMIIGIVVTSVVLLAAIGGIVIALSGGNDTAVSTITPGDPAPPPETSSDSPTPDQPTPTESDPASSKPNPTPSKATDNPGGKAISLGQGISLTPAPGWTGKSKDANLAVLDNGQEQFVGQVAVLKKGTDPKAVVDGYHEQLAKKYSDPKYTAAEDVDLKSSNLTGASGSMVVTAASGQGSAQIIVVSIASVRTDGVAVVGTLYFFQDSDTDQLDRDYGAMVSSMLKGQAAG